MNEGVEKEWTGFCENESSLCLGLFLLATSCSFTIVLLFWGFFSQSKQNTDENQLKGERFILAQILVHVQLPKVRHNIKVAKAHGKRCCLTRGNQEKHR